MPEETAVSSSNNLPHYKKQKTATFLALFALLIAIATAVGSIFGLHTKETSQEKLLATIDQLDSRLNNLESTVTQQQSLIQKNQLELQQLTQGKEGNAIGWIIAEIDYLVQQANLVLQTNHDKTVALSLLQAAYQKIMNNSDIRLYPINQALNHDINALQTAPAVDRAELLSRLTNINQQIQQLPLVPNYLNQKATSEPITKNNTTQVSPWQIALAKSLEMMRQIVIIQKHQAVTPLLSDEQALFLRQNIMLMLGQAQWAVLQNNQVIYNKSLQQTIEWLQRFFIVNPSTNQTLLAQLKELQKININPALPLPTMTLAAIQATQLHKAAGGTS